MGIHLPDFHGDSPGLLDQYRRNTASMCGSQPRFSLYENFRVGDDHLPVFRPALSYTNDGADVDVGRLWEPGWLNGHSSGTPIRWHAAMSPNGVPPPRPAWVKPERPSGYKRSDPSTSVTGNKTQYGNQTQEYEGSIIITSFPEHQIAELCESPTSWGPSLANTKENLFCDMTTKKSWPICKSGTSCACLDLGSYSSPQNATSMSANTTQSSPHNAGSGLIHKRSVLPFLRTSCGRNIARDAAPSRSFDDVLVWS
ncbi:MAG: hypothetical protein M1822_007588 [Bathelium mastoideum]|nr:MAG: hypothetical protein M1822_007588 [Bathelium mastoideum]